MDQHASTIEHDEHQQQDEARQPTAWDVVDRPQPWAGTYEAVVAAAREKERQDSARRLQAWAASLPERSASLVALEAAEVVRGSR